MADTIRDVRGGFFDSVNRDRLYSADDMNNPYKNLIKDGIFDKNGGFEVHATGMTVYVSPGNALIGGKWAESGTVTFTVTAPSAGSTYREDCVVLRMDPREHVRSCQIIYRTGSTELVTGNGIVEFRLARVIVNPGTTSLDEAITDDRGTAECPLATLEDLGVSDQIAGDVTSWLTENVDPVGSAVVVDSSLTISGAAADAKTTGDAITNVNNEINKLGLSVVDGKLCMTFTE